MFWLRNKKNIYLEPSLNAHAEESRVINFGLSLTLHAFFCENSAVCSDADCRSRGRKLDPGPVPYFWGD